MRGYVICIFELPGRREKKNILTSATTTKPNGIHHTIALLGMNVFG